jgi:D-alanine-D-alanine ligase
MEMEKLKVAVIYNEPEPELYKKLSPGKTQDVEYRLYYEFDELTPMEEYEIIAKKLRKVGLEAYTLNIKDNLKLLLDNLEKNKPDVIFNFVELFKDKPNYEMNIVGIYELLGISYTGAPALALANCQNKILSKRLLELNGVRIPPYFIVEKKATEYPHNIKYPLLVKPSLEDASVGIENDSIVSDEAGLRRRIDYVLHYFDQPVLVEEFIEGRELNVSVIGDKKPKALPISEIDFSEMPDHLHNIVSYQAKWDPKHESYHKTIPKCPAELSKEIETTVKETAIKAFRIMGCRDYARVDMRLSKNNKLYILEVNPNPDITDGAGFMRSAIASGLAYSQTLKKIVLLAAARGKS